MFHINYQRVIIATLLTFFYHNATIFAKGCIEGNNIPATERREAPAFNSISISGAFDVDIQSQSTQQITVTTDKNILPHIKTQVKSGTLYIFTDRSICTKNELRVNLANKLIQKITSSGANDISFSRINNRLLEIEIKDAVEITLSGKTKTLIANLFDAADMEAENLFAKDVQITVNGAGDATVHASKKLNAIVDGAGSITFHGNPVEVIKKISAAGELIRE